MNMKIAATGMSLGIIGAINSFSVSLFNVPGTVPLLAFTGALLSYGYEIDGLESPRRGRRFWLSLVANTITATAAVSVIPQFLGWDWYSTKMEGSVAFLFALGGRFVIPLVFKMLPEIIRKWFKIGEYKQNKSETDDAPK